MAQAAKKSACSSGAPGSIPGPGRSPGGGNGYPLQYSCPKNPMDRPRGRKEVDTNEQLTHTHTKCTITFMVTQPLFFLRFNSVLYNVSACPPVSPSSPNICVSFPLSSGRCCLAPGGGGPLVTWNFTLWRPRSDVLSSHQQGAEATHRRQSL